ncbi:MULTISPECIES: MoaD/ThiS family protein [unclassified Gordonia (in: high G+C Gram-positive bacteria)]|uniref:MoaD/ThiS family protein n=1 Tax=unclassified Gordonia (in: high G+C Gram-positive bacteria) TaxID=2657482 RepID=UPI001F0FE635|nr:MoaD/ThiS family protein [Gordonia sp. ABSL49_1]MCH5643202.1 MoaD/ThiS family protein [Gordonia sp. ABSL49_1]
MRLTVRYFAAARAASGTEHDVVEIDADATLGDLERLLAAEKPSLAPVLQRCSYLRDEVALCDRARRLGTCEVIDVLPPFAGG